MTQPHPEPAGEETPPPPPAVEPPVQDVPWGFGDAVAVILLWFVILVALVGLVLLPALHAMLPDASADAALLPVSAALLIVVTLLYVRARHPGNVGRLFGPARPGLRAVGYGVAVGVVALLVFIVGLGNLLQYLAELAGGELPPVQEQYREIAGVPEAVPLLVFGSVLVAPLAEELFYRGMLFTALRRRMERWPAMGISGALFALSHFQTGDLEGTMLVVLIIMPLGMFLAYVYERRRSLVVPFTAHAVFNLVQVLLLVRTGQAG